MLTSDDNTYKVAKLSATMPGTLISVRVSPKLLSQARSIANKRGASLQELMRETLRSMVEREQLSALYGSQPRHHDLTREERDAIAHEIAKEVLSGRSKKLL